MIAALLLKDLTLYARNRFFALVSVLALLAYVALFFLAPDTADAPPALGLWVEGGAPSALAERLTRGLTVMTFPTEAALRDAVLTGQPALGLPLSSGELAALDAGHSQRLRLLVAPGTPPALQQSFSTLLALALNDQQGGGTLAGRLRVTEEVLGPDLLATPLSLRDRLLPTLLLMLLVVELMGMATLVAEERARGTANALLVTPLSRGGLLLGKALLGIGLAFAQLALLLLLTGQLRRAPVLLLVALLLGSGLVTGLAFLVASVARDLLGVMAWSMLLLIVLALPALALLFPTLASRWVEAIPTYYLVDTLHRALNLGAGWGEVAGNLGRLALSSALALGLGSTVLRRKLA